MEVWESRWLIAGPMPDAVLPDDLRRAMLDIASAWVSRLGPESWVKVVLLARAASLAEAQKVMAGLMWTGFRLRNKPGRPRAQPVPVCLRLLYERPVLIDPEGLVKRMSEILVSALGEWGRTRDRLGTGFIPGP